jgi:hypothetical protein
MKTDSGSEDVAVKILKVGESHGASYYTHTFLQLSHR